MADDPEARTFEQHAQTPDPGLLADVFLFLRENRAWWLVPIVVVLAMFGVVLALLSSTAAPLLYTLF